MRTLLIPLSLLLGATSMSVAQQPSAPKILLDASPRAVDYQLSRLSNDELTRVDRKVDDSRYRPVYLALLIRKGVAPQYFDEALAALIKMAGQNQSEVLIEGLAKIDAKDDQAAARLLRALLRQPAATLQKEQPLFARALESRNSPFAVQAAYGAMIVGDGKAGLAWGAASKRDGDLVELLRSVPYIGARELRVSLFEPIAALMSQTRDPVVRAAALAALSWTREDAATFHLIAQDVLQGDDVVRAAAVRGLSRLPREAWPPAEIEPLARGLVASLGKVAPELRTEATSVDAMQLAEKLTDALPDEARRTLRRDLRTSGVQVVRIETVVEEMLFDVKWFAVEAGKRVQIVLSNPDAMSHNLLIVKPGALKEVGTAAASMSISVDPAAKAYVPNLPLVLQSTRLLNWGESARLNFAAPTEPGEYPFLCTFPGHWVRMYGVMLVVPNLDAWDARRTVPTDPVTNKPFTSQRK